MAVSYNMQPVPQALIRKIGALPREYIAEVEDFVDFIAMKDSANKGSAMKENDHALTRAAAAASAPAFARVWNNPEDDVYDAL